jgi:hypothetical protein
VTNFIILCFVAFPQLIETIRIGFVTSTYDPYPKIVNNAEEYKQD